MGVFDSSSDIPNQIKTEGETITVSFSPGDPATGQGTVRWNIPTPALGCNSETDGAYCGMLVLLSTTALTSEHIPQDGTFYTGDPTADADLHAGDKIAGALVVGSFYEGEKKSRNETLTTELVVSGLSPNTPYYVIGYAVDCQGRYHSDGQRAYSADFGNAVEPGTPGTQSVLLGEIDEQNEYQGILPTDGTGLVPGMPYEFDIVINPNFPTVADNRTVNVYDSGENFGTYQDLVDQINKAIALADNPPQSPVPPDQGRYYWNGESLSQWDGNQHVPVDAVIEPTDPAVVAAGTYWYDPDNDVLQLYSGAVWTPVNTIAYHKDPTQLFGGGDYWYDGAQGYSWCATTWCEETTFSQETDPGAAPVPTCGDYWFDSENNQLYNWSTELETWVEVLAVEWNVEPNNLLVGDYWFDTTAQELNQWTGAAWTNLAVVISDEAPDTSTYVGGEYWYNPELEELKQWNIGLLDWDDLTVLVHPVDPSNTESCDLWWRTTDDKLFKWDTTNAEWDEVYQFQISATDPFLPPNIEVGTLWYVPSADQMKRWDGINWIDVTHINYPTDPTQPATGDAWHDTANNKWYIWDTPTASVWNEVNPVDSTYNPTATPAGTLWYDTTNNALFERVGAAWVNVPFSTQAFYPTHGDFWFDTTNDVLMEWKRDPLEAPLTGPGSWVESTPLATAKITDDGHLLIATTGTGSNNMVMILVPEGTSRSHRGGLATGAAGADCCYHYDYFADVPVLQTDVPVERFLFEQLVPPGKVLLQTYGSDDVHELPSYEQLGVGDDGSPDERRQIMDWVRSQLGYPVIQVELTQKQIDEAVDMAIETIRQRTSLAYERGAFFLDVEPHKQHYRLTDRTCGWHKVVTVTSAHRFTSAFLSSAHGSGVYGQIVLQHLYNMGTFDLLSYHLVSQYVEQLEHLFATRLVFHWNEGDRILSFYQAFTVRERILLDVMLERTEQSIMKDRWARTWVKRFALMRGMEILSQIRGKYATLPGAGGGVSLNAADLIAKATELREELNTEIEDFIADDPEGLGMHSTFILG